MEMDMDTYERLAGERRRRGTRFNALIDDVEGSDDEEEEEEQQQRAAAGAGVAGELPCPFCGEELDAVGMLCHMEDEHHAEANAGDKWRNQQGSSGSRYLTLASLKRDLQERISGSSRAAPVSTVPDPLLSSFVGNFSEVDLTKNAKKETLAETEVGSDNLDQKASDSVDEPEVKVERTRRSQFVQGLVLSLIFEDIL